MQIDEYRRLRPALNAVYGRCTHSFAMVYGDLYPRSWLSNVVCNVVHSLIVGYEVREEDWPFLTLPTPCPELEIMDFLAEESDSAGAQ